MEPQILRIKAVIKIRGDNNRIEIPPPPFPKVKKINERKIYIF